MRSPRATLVAAFAGALLTLSGCGKIDPASRLAELNKTNLQRVTNLYLAFQAKHNFYGPRHMQDLRGFVEALNPAKLERIGVDAASIDGLFVSERDGQPFNIRFGVRGSAMGSKEPVVFEAEGEDGRRMVGFLNMTSKEVESPEYDRLWDQGARALAAG